MSTRVFSLLAAYAYRQARRSQGRMWWIVLGAVALTRAIDRRGDREESTNFTLRQGQSLDLEVAARTVR